MNQWTRILIPVGLGVVAFVMNSWTISNAIAPQTYVTINQNASKGSVITADMLQPIELTGNHERLKTVWFLWHQRSTILGTQIRRPLQQGDPILKVDIDWNQNLLGPRDVQVTVPTSIGAFEPSLINPGDRVKFILEYSRGSNPQPLGPYRVVAVGARTRAYSASYGSDRANSITVAVMDETQAYRDLQAAISYGSVKSIELLPENSGQSETNQSAANVVAYQAKQTP